jgi:hypothetical protein
VARIAYDKLSKESPNTLDKANAILAHLSQFTTMEKDHPFVEAATFGDAIKSKGFDDQADWHFVDNPFMDEGYSTSVNPEPFNITWAIVIKL